ncbi:hypothetical protein ACFQRK_15375 [Parapedobacter sp. GCM10030251]|jgi:hypothetical protein|uniref:hypothetical protein n=1 Tax=Parapedobacter sp. GCM10030251 TaxID=3273419 RepID=UPI0036142DDE
MQTKIERIKHSLELDEKLDHQQKGWMVQKICSIGIGIIVVLTALGLFGDGWLSSKKIVINGTSLHYEKFLRYEKEMNIGWAITDQKEVQFLIPMRYLDHFKIEKVVPESYETAITEGYVSYTFKANPAAQTLVRFYLNPQKTGSVRGEWLVNKQSFKFMHFIYP